MEMSSYHPAQGGDVPTVNIVIYTYTTIMLLHCNIISLWGSLEYFSVQFKKEPAGRGLLSMIKVCHPGSHSEPSKGPKSLTVSKLAQLYHSVVKGDWQVSLRL